MWVLEAILLVVLPYGMAIICGAVTEAAGKLVSGYCSLGGLALGIYFFEKHAASFGGLITRDHCIGHPTMSVANGEPASAIIPDAECHLPFEIARANFVWIHAGMHRQHVADVSHVTHVNRPRPVSVRHELFTIGPKKVRPTANEKRFLSNFASDSALMAMSALGPAPSQRFFDVAAALVGCGHASGLFVRWIWPLALMLCADRVPIESTGHHGFADFLPRSEFDLQFL
jgi:hypothetical protein